MTSQMTQFPADTPVTLWMCRPTVQRNARQRKSVLNGGFLHVSWADTQSQSRGCAAPRWGPTFWWRGRLVEGFDKTNEQTIFGKEQSVFQPGAFRGLFQRQKTRTNTWMHTRWETRKKIPTRGVVWMWKKWLCKLRIYINGGCSNNTYLNFVPVYSSWAISVVPIMSFQNKMFAKTPKVNTFLTQF